MLKIYTQTIFYTGMRRSDVMHIFEIENITPIWNTMGVVAYVIPNARFIRNGNNMTYVGRGNEAYVWAFQFDNKGCLLQQGVMPPKS